MVLQAGVPSPRLSVIPNAARIGAFAGADPESRRQLESFCDEGAEYVVVGAGRLSPEKGVPVLVTAAAEVLRELPGSRFIVFGEGTQRPAIERMIATNGLRGRFVLPGFRTDLDCLLPSADLFVLPSLTEGMPNVVLEASAAGVPVVATAVGGTPEVIAHGRTGYLVPKGDADRLAQAIIELLKDEPRRLQLAQAGREFVRTHFTFEAQAAAYCSLFERLGIGRRRRRRKTAA
jgi:glycosyltransferase involved in cell wall biosynthesis